MFGFLYFFHVHGFCRLSFKFRFWIYTNMLVFIFKAWFPYNFLISTTHQRHYYWSMFHILFPHRRPTSDEFSFVENLKIKLKWKSSLVVLKSIKHLKPPATHRRLIAVMFIYKFLEVAGTAMEKKLNKYQLFFGVWGGLPWVADSWNEEFPLKNSMSPLSLWWVAGTRQLYGNHA